MRRLALLGVPILAAAASAQEPARNPAVDGAIADIGAGRRVAEARRVLKETEDRDLVLRALDEAVAGDSFDVRAKASLLATSVALGDDKAPRRAIESLSVTARRAASILLWGDAELKARCGEIALEWLKDGRAEDRATAAKICGHLGLEEARPVLLGIVAKDPTTESERALFVQALAGVGDPKPEELVERLFALASDAAMDEDIRGIALDSLQSMRDGPRERVLRLSTGILADPAENRILRMKAALGLRRFPEDRAREALEAVLLSEKEENRILQRNCLYSLGQMEPADEAVARRYLDRLRQLLTDRRVYGNPYFAVKVDVATALSALDARDPVTLDIMGEYLVDEDPQDKEHLVRQEAWMTLWVLTGAKLPDLPEPDLFQVPPAPFPDPLRAREYLFRRAHFRPGITREQSAMVARVAADLEGMRKTRETYQSLRARILEKWRGGKPPPEPPESRPEGK